MTAPLRRATEVFLVRHGQTAWRVSRQHDHGRRKPIHFNVSVFGRERIARMSPESVLNASTIQPITDFIMQFSLGGMARMRSISE